MTGVEYADGQSAYSTPVLTTPRLGFPQETAPQIRGSHPATTYCTDVI
ncbi:hypothetical protein H1P_4190003 [Hyella patelloides LEGE 07179]|uniref:Uncharacterized protein n=1 Tax=Hyella patelloides LEGE 07179 TaxID=945734 RepID=A0A563VXT1_9CYAN|nr:hypothetical protein [Hyella patelloides]VEP16197.1 hypothetical protein H1P_4190003 [Hyella patelloides LEGE 07179]